MALDAHSTPAPVTTRRARRLSAEARANLIETLCEEFDLLCMGIPSPWRIEQAIARAEEVAA